jgi:hypothetical protein
MYPHIEILDTSNLDRLSALAADPTANACRYVSALVQAGADAFVENANVEMRALVVDGKVLPLAINRGVDGNADICSPYEHYVSYTLEELAKRHPRVPPGLLRASLSPLSALLRAGRIDGAVLVNNWLFTTNPSPGLSAAEIAVVTDRLTGEYPDLAVVFRSVNPRTDSRTAAALREQGYRMVRSRRVYLLDTAGGGYLRHRNAFLDRRLLERTPYQIVRQPEALAPYAPRLAELYRDLYVEKHSRLNAQCNARFFALTLAEGIFTYRALWKAGRIDGFIGWYVQPGVMTASTLGYDRRVPRKLGLLRLVFAIVMAEAAERGLLLNLSAGVGRFKMLRGAVQAEEYDAVYDRHLPAHRRLAWATLAAATDIGSWRGRARPEGIDPRDHPLSALGGAARVVSLVRPKTLCGTPLPPPS